MGKKEGIMALGIIVVLALGGCIAEYNPVGNEAATSRGIARSENLMPMVRSDKVIDEMPKVSWRDSGIQDRMPRVEPPMAQSAR